MPQKNNPNKNNTYMHNQIKKIIKKHGPRGPTSKEETAAGKDILNEMNKYADQASREKFTCHPKGFLGWMKITAPLYIISALIYFFKPEFLWISIILSITGFFLFFKQFLQYAEFIDPLFPEGTSYNIVGKFKPKNETKNTIIYSGHHDSAYQFNIISWAPKAYPIIMVIAIAGVIFLPIITPLNYALRLISFNWIITDYLFTAAPWFFIFTTPFAFLFLFFETGKPVPGAMDNLSSVSIVLGMAKYLNEIRGTEEYPNNTEVICVSFGCEEVGLRGSRRYVEKHLDELTQRKNVKVINMDGIAEPDEFTIIKREKTTRTNHSIKLAKHVKNLAEKNLGISMELEDMSIGGGGTDATPFSRVGVPAISIFAVPMNPMPDYYHTMRDTPDKVKPETLSRTLSICKEYLRDIDEKTNNHSN